MTSTNDTHAFCPSCRVFFVWKGKPKPEDGWCQRDGHALVRVDHESDRIYRRIRKPLDEEAARVRRQERQDKRDARKKSV